MLDERWPSWPDPVEVFFRFDSYRKRKRSFPVFSCEVDGSANTVAMVITTLHAQSTTSTDFMVFVLVEHVLQRRKLNFVDDIPHYAHINSNLI